MKLNKQRLMEMAGLNEEANNPYKKHKGYIAVYRVMGQDFTVGPLKTNDKQEVLDMLGNAIMGGFRLMDIVPADQFKGVEKYGGLMLEDRVDEIQLGITNPNDDEAMNSVLDKASFDQNQSIEDGHYGLTDNLPGLIKDLEELEKMLSSDSPWQEKQAVKNEIKIYKDIQVLMDMSALGKLL